MKYKSVLNMVVFAISLTTIVLPPQVKAQGKQAQPKMLTSFCGFKAGENKNTIKAVPSKIPNAPDAVKARKPFRMFKDVFLKDYDANDGLCFLTAIAIVDKMNISAAQKELDVCCKELEKSGIIFGSWNADISLCERKGYGRGVDDVVVSGQIMQTVNSKGKETTQALLQIDILWNPNYFIRPPMKVKEGNFNPKIGITRKEFVEKAFGLKFGEELLKYIKTDKFDTEFPQCVTRIISSPIAGADIMVISLENKNNVNEINQINFSSLCPVLAKDMDEVKKLCDIRILTLSKWLGNAKFEDAESLMAGGRASKFTEDGFCVKMDFNISSTPQGTFAISPIISMSQNE